MHMLKRILLIALLSIPSYSLHAQRHDVGTGMIYLYAGGTTANVHTDAQFDVSQEVLEIYPGASTSINLEEDLDFPASNELFYIRGIVGGRLQLAFSYFKLHREGGARLTKSFVFGDNSYEVSAPVSGFFNTDYYSASLRFSIVHTPIVTAGLSIGGRYLMMNAGIHADSMGYVFDKSEDLDAPVIVPGIFAGAYALPGLLFRGSLEYFTLSISGTTGTVLESQLSAEYYLLKYLGIGVGYSWTHFKVEDLPENDIYLKNVNYRVDGLNLFAAFRF
jgi:hypothetical protein